MTEKPDSVMKHEKFQDLMKRYHGQIENALYAIEQLCPGGSNEDCKHCLCFMPRLGCKAVLIREIIGERFPQDDIQIPDDNTPSERKLRR